MSGFSIYRRMVMKRKLSCILRKLEQIRRNGKMAEEKKEKFESSYPKGVRIAAIIGVIF